ncbi:MAG: hypothetical protein VB120_01005 [Lachnospiraceae bacterium]|nr:hypothetical protein [Lachnospiraceae bacterium]
MKKESISANEINKFTYCPYQWYYEKIYGRKEIRRLAAIRNEEANANMLENYSVGSKHHSYRYVNYKISRCLNVIIFVVIVFTAAFLLIKFGML